MESKTKKKAKLIEKFWCDGYQGIRVTTLIYEYRGHRYEVEDNPWDRFSNPLWQQHKDAQEKIDEAIANPKIEKEHKHEDSAEYAFDKLWSYWETGEWHE